MDRLLQLTSRTFALSIPVLPEPTRSEVTVAYLLFRIADTLEDAVLWSRARQLKELSELVECLRTPSLERVRAASSRWMRDPPCEHKGYLELLDTAESVFENWQGLAPQARDLVGQHTVKTAEQMAQFLEQTGEDNASGLRDVAELRAYCYAVAGIVGELLTELFILERPRLAALAPGLRERAAEFGEALQLVNILRDAGVDATEGRRYLPAGVDLGELFSLARNDLAIASQYVTTLHAASAPRGVVAFTSLPVLLARRTLDLVEEHGAGSKVTRAEVMKLVRAMDAALDRNESPVLAS